MKMSQLMVSTLRETPAEAEVVSHKLMLRAGMIRKVAAGVYSYLPLGYRTIKKIENIIRQEMDSKGGQELLLPAIQPAELWKESGRWQVYGDEMMRLQDRHKREFCLGPTHEEVITDLVKRDIKSYKQLPVLLYQIQTKYRDEIRPRFGLMRGREFIMKDLYSFDRNQDGLDESYEKMYDAYCRVFERCGLEYRAVEADSGAIGGNASHEFMVIAESGEAAVVYCSECNYAANQERAEYFWEQRGKEEDSKPLEKILTPNVKTIVQLEEFLNIPAEKFIKTLFYQVYYADKEELVAVLVRGDRDANEIKVKNILNCLDLELAPEEKVAELCLPLGFVGPLDLYGKIQILADQEVMEMVNAVAGSNEKDYHLLNVNPARDFQVSKVADLRLVIQGDMCPKCKSSLKVTRGIEVGHIFKLGTKYSEALEANFLDENGKAKPFIMGCYGIGVGRTAAAAIEQNYDENGIVWPMPIAPYHVIVIPVNAKDEQQKKIAENIYESLLAVNVEVVLDDRNERPGVKFKDADLIGFPLKIVVGPKTIEENLVELKIRRTGEEERLEVKAVTAHVQAKIEKEIK